MCAHPLLRADPTRHTRPRVRCSASIVSLAQKWLPAWRVLAPVITRMPLPPDPAQLGACASVCLCLSVRSLVLLYARTAASAAIADAEARRRELVQGKTPKPEILGVVPANSSLLGSPLLVHGDNFSVGVVVRIGGELVPASKVQLLDVHHVMVLQTPAFRGVCSACCVRCCRVSHDRRRGRALDHH
jgi:hypothetical protein